MTWYYLNVQIQDPRVKQGYCELSFNVKDILRVGLG